MRTTAAGTGLAGLVTALANAGRYALAGLGLLITAAMAALCWVITNRARTRNAVALIAAVRGPDRRPTPSLLPTDDRERPVRSLSRQRER
jgi:hypothetical protein